MSSSRSGARRSPRAFGISSKIALSEKKPRAVTAMIGSSGLR